MNLAVVLSTFVAVFLAELGDKCPRHPRSAEI